MIGIATAIAVYLVIGVVVFAWCYHSDKKQLSEVPGSRYGTDAIDVIGTILLWPICLFLMWR